MFNNQFINKHRYLNTTHTLTFKLSPEFLSQVIPLGAHHAININSGKGGPILIPVHKFIFRQFDIRHLDESLAKSIGIDMIDMPPFPQNELILCEHIVYNLPDVEYILLVKAL